MGNFDLKLSGSVSALFNPTENSHYRKYLATLGVSIILAAITAGGFLFRSQADLLIDQKKLGELTPVARQAIEKRQHMILFATTWSPWIVAALCTIGCGIAIFGLRGWSRRQKEVDTREDLEKEKIKAEIRSLTPLEIEEKATEDAKLATGEATTVTAEDAAAVNEYNVQGLSNVTTFGAPNIEPSPNKSESSESGNRLQVHKIIKEIEDTFLAKLTSSFPNQRVHPQVAIGATSGKARRADAVISSPKTGKDYVFELKYVSGERPIGPVTSVAIAQAARAAQELNKNQKRVTLPVAVIVVDDHRSAPPHVVRRSSDPNFPSKILILHFTRSQLSEVTAELLRFLIETGFEEE